MTRLIVDKGTLEISVRLAAVGLVVAMLSVGCFASPDEDAPRVTAGLVPTGEVRELGAPEEVEQFVRQYGECAVAHAPGAGLAIEFDRDTGFVSGSEAAALGPALLDQLEAGMDSCDAKLAFQASIDAYVLNTPSAREPAEGGSFVPVEGERLVFGNQSLFE